MSQHDAWEKEYRKPKLVTLSEEPHNDVRKFWRFLKKESGSNPSAFRVLDLGSGTGKHAFYFAELGASVVGMEISETAIALAKKRVVAENLNVQFLHADIGKPYPFDLADFDLVLDVLSSNSLNETERETYLHETYRTLKPDGWLFVKILCKDRDENARALLVTNPGKEKDTYTIKEIGLTERVFSRNDFENTYGKYFSIRKLEKSSSYTLFNNRRYKRNFWIAYCQKKTG